MTYLNLKVHEIFESVLDVNQQHWTERNVGLILTSFPLVKLYRKSNGTLCFSLKNKSNATFESVAVYCTSGNVSLQLLKLFEQGGLFLGYGQYDDIPIPNRDGFSVLIGIIID